MKRQSGTPAAPGWYPDEATGRLRRWDGRTWTGETRDMPPWMGGEVAPGGPGATGGTGGGLGSGLGTGGGGRAGKRRIGRHWLVLGGFVLVLFGIVSVKAWNAGPDLPPRTVFDAEFVTAANASCRTSLVPMKKERPQPGTPEGRDPGPKEKVAGQVDSTADRLVVVADDLRKIPVRAEDKAAVDGWLGDLVLYADVGHRYADAVRDDSPRQEGIVKEAREVARRADRFALANGLRDCTLA